ncbi:ATP-binding cassette domain-containing protein [Nonomuraea dietziae]|uniref:ATP-binding cassette domain-containing protein n=1 Tax=Nonomuraea dietziae TaxID=65515 RepID=UPI0031DA1A73
MLYRDRDITRYAPHRIAHVGLGRTFQLCRVFPRMTVMENMLVAVRRTRLRELLAGTHATGEVERARHWLTPHGHRAPRTRRGRNLSYGQQKLLELAAVFMGDPELVCWTSPRAA